MTAGVDSMMYAGDIKESMPWHGIGKNVEEAPDSRTAWKMAGLDFDVESQEIFVYNGQAYETVPGFYANVKVDSGVVLGIVGERYRTFQNWEMFQFLDSLLTDGSMTYETAGSLFGGRKVWALGRLATDFRIADDEYHSYMLASTGHDGKTGVIITPTEVRVVCNNTLTMAVGQRGERAKFNFRHDSSLSANLAKAQEALRITTQSQRSMMDWMARAVTFELRPHHPDLLVEELFGEVNEATTTYSRNQIDKFRNILKEEIEHSGANAYAAMNAVTGFATHAMRYHGSKTNPLLKQERRFDGVFGGRSLDFQRKGREVLVGLGAK